MNHPKIIINGRPMFAHVHRAEQALEKPLPKGAEVHHHSFTELVICPDRAYHMILHQRARALKVCGHANWRKCVYCKKYDAPENLHISKEFPYHRACMNAKRTARKKANREKENLRRRLKYAEYRAKGLSHHDFKV